MAADRPGESVNHRCDTLFFFHGAVEQEVEEHNETKQLSIKAFWPEVFKTKTHKGLTQDQKQQLGVWNFHCRLNWLLYTLIIHPNFKQAHEQDMENDYNSWHLQHTDA